MYLECALIQCWRETNQFHWIFVCTHVFFCIFSHLQDLKNLSLSYFSKTNLICFALRIFFHICLKPSIFLWLHLHIFFSNQSHLPCLCLLPRSSPPPSGGRHHKQFQSDVFEIAERYFDVYPQCYFNHTNISQYFISNQPICLRYFDVYPIGLLQVPTHLKKWIQYLVNLHKSVRHRWWWNVVFVFVEN